MTEDLLKMGYKVLDKEKYDMWQMLVYYAAKNNMLATLKIVLDVLIMLKEKNIPQIEDKLIADFRPLDNVPKNYEHLKNTLQTVIYLVPCLANKDEAHLFLEEFNPLRVRDEAINKGREQKAKLNK